MNEGVPSIVYDTHPVVSFDTHPAKQAFIKKMEESGAKVIGTLNEADTSPFDPDTLKTELEKFGITDHEEVNFSANDKIAEDFLQTRQVGETLH